MKARFWAQECICICGERAVVSKNSHPIHHVNTSFSTMQQCVIRKRKLLVTWHDNPPVSGIRGTGRKNMYLPFRTGWLWVWGLGLGGMGW
ncbi:hypothetical protein L873DRAFT_781844 [Choiromyces venosus 120613-1]|uniref:Uncharacterized protein n=1 Tax=Choiromyces venosus 120613-1 TaxID=1336337 RepID=A0A3N4IU68_9PEZI|nr:hypothetical protein L873DRAFT_781844 [Choiromyces venosus 120613-1]